jgi:DNA-binding helix-hairpin-helix protein with protein kinase domain
MPVQTRAKPALFDVAGQPLYLGPKVGSGGEGAIYELSDRSDVVVKLYHKSLDPEKSAKIATMAKFGNERLLKLTAWPIEPIRVGSGAGPIVGFTMSKITGHKQAFSVYSPKLRLQESQNVSWQFLIRCAANAARAFKAVHESGHVIGDVNDGNLLVGKKATVCLIDCDSYQITLNGSRWLCEVGTPPYQPPELQNIRTYRGVVRTSNHDCFGLAVIIFRILFMARHPFSGRFLGTDQMPMERAISEYRFVYGPNAAAMQMQPPPVSLGLNGVTQDVALLFERAFSERGSEQNGRPRPDEWVRALENLEKHLKKCTANPAHQFVDTLRDCPWCKIEAAIGIPLFPLAVPSTGFTIAAFWARVESVPNPGPPPPPPRIDGLAATLLPVGVKVQKATAEAILAGGLPALIDASRRIESLKKEIETKTADARSRWRNLQSNWNIHVRSKDFQDIYSFLRDLRKEYESIPQRRLQDLQKLESDKYGLQLRSHLDRCRISHARIKGVGDAKKAMLQSYGVETAADIVDQRVLAVPGFGPVLLGNLKHWRDQQQRRFVFDPNKGVDQTAKNAIERQILARKIEVERKLGEGLAKLTASSLHIRTRRRALLAQAEQAARDLAQAQADLQAAEQATRDLAEVRANLRAAEQAARDRPKAEARLRAVAPFPSAPRATQSSNVDARRTARRAILALGATVIGGLILVSYQGNGPSPATPQRVSQQRIQLRAIPPIPPQPASPPHMGRDASGQLRPEDGYDWADGNHTSARWMSGKISRKYPHVIASDTEGEWQPDDGYDWDNSKDKSVRWVPGISSTHYPHIVAAGTEGQWRPADGYTWVISPPRPGDMRVIPARTVDDLRAAINANATSSGAGEKRDPTPQGQSGMLNPAPLFQAGLADRTDWERWIAGQSGEFRRGAEWWASHRSLVHPGSCDGPAATSPDFEVGCEAAKARLTPTDLKRKSDPEYRRGWNNYNGAISPAPATDLQASPVEETPQASEPASADRLNAQELNQLKSQ